MSDCVEESVTEEHQHRGKSSECLLDVPAILAGLGVQPGWTALDAGCGNGYMAKLLAKLVGPKGKVYAIDPDDVSITLLQLETEDMPVDAFVGDMTRRTRLLSATMDLVYVSLVLHGFTPARTRAFVQEVKRLLKPGGRLAVVEINKVDTPFGPPLHMRFTPAELSEAVGLKPVGLFEAGRHFYLQLFAN